MKLFKENIAPRLSTLGDKIYPLVVDIKKGVKSGDAVNFVTADNEVGILSIELVNGDEPYDISGCIVCGTIQRPDTSTLNIYCDIVGANKLEIPLGVSGTYQEGIHNFDLKIYRGNEKVIGIPTMSYSVSGSLSSDDVAEGDDRLPVLTTVLDNAQDKLTRLDKAIAGATNDLEVKEARDGEVSLHARLERDLAKGKIHFVDVEGSSVSTESEEGYLENVEIHGNTWQDSENLEDIRSVGTKVEGQELYEIPVLSIGKNIFSGNILLGRYDETGNFINDDRMYTTSKFKVQANKTIIVNHDNIKTIWINFWDVNMNHISQVPVHPYNNITTPINCVICSITGSIGATLNNLQVEYETIATPYEPYKEDKLTILSPTPIEKVGDVADRIVCKDGVWGVEKNIKTVMLNGSENWKDFTIRTESTNIVTLEVSNDVIPKINVVCNRFVYLPSNEVEEHARLANGKEHIRIFISNEKASSLIEFKKWCESNPLIIKYHFAQPQFIPLPHSQQIKLRTFAGRTNIHFDTEIEPTIKAQVPKSLGATVNSHTTQIDNLNKELDRVKKLEESTVSTVTSDKAFTTVAETTGGYFEDVKIEGKTLVNLAQKAVNTYTITSNSSGVIAKVNTKPLTTYTLAVTFSDNKCTSSDNIGIFLCQTVFSAGVNLSGYDANGTVIRKITTGENPVSDWMIGARSSFKGTVSVSNFILLEGDHTDKDITFFEGLKSVGQDTDEISVSSVNENLFDGVWESGGINAEGVLANLNCVRTKDFIQVKSNSLIKFRYPSNYNRSFYIHEYDSNFNVCAGEKVVDPANNILTTNPNTKYIKFNTVVLTSLDITLPLNHMSVTMQKSSEKDTIHQSDKKQILYFNPTTETWEKPVLREWDSIEKHSDGKYYYHKRSGEVVLNGSESWYSVSTLENVLGFGVGIDLHGVTDLSKIISDRFNFVGEDKLGQIRLGNSGKSIFIFIDNTKLSTQNVVGFKQWLQANNVTVVYQLAKEEVYECTNLDLITYNGETNLIVSSGAIQPRITLKVLSNVSNIVKLLQEKVSILENKFIKGLQQVLAGDMMSLAHLLYPEDFENNHEIQTLEL